MNGRSGALIALCLVLLNCSSAPKSGTKSGTETAASTTPQYTAADLPKLTGLVIPPDLPQIASRTNRLRAQVVSAVKTTTKDPIVQKTLLHPDLCDPKSSVVDFRKKQLVSPVKDQQECGACWAFASNAVLESSYLILRGEHISASEQELISCSSAGNCGGGWWAFDFQMKPGIESDRAYPYEHSSSECRMPISVEFRALQSGYVASIGEESSIPSDADLKGAMCKHGPLAVGFTATPAFVSFGYQHHNQASVFSENNKDPVNHGIVLVGWDDTQQAWIIKNSWNTTWGDQGFLYVKYGTNNIGFGAAWAEAWPPDYDPAPKVRRLLTNKLTKTAKVSVQ